ncbi:D-arabinono-1,4-lactone oxidase [Kineococcus aurantiacus]
MDDAWPSPTAGVASVSINLCRTWGPDNGPSFRAVEGALDPFPVRPHWGRQPYLRTPDFHRSVYPPWNGFIQLRHQLVTTGTFINTSLRRLSSER